MYLLWLYIGNAIKNADTPVMDALTKGEYLTVDASGLAVGLPAGLMGNSEVGHFTIGTGKVVYQVRSELSWHTFVFVCSELLPCLLDSHIIFH